MTTHTITLDAYEVNNCPDQFEDSEVTIHFDYEPETMDEKELIDVHDVVCGEVSVLGLFNSYSLVEVVRAYREEMSEEV